jgi:ABC-type multidrug transport system fused ATPase/permease subunit
MAKVKDADEKKVKLTKESLKKASRIFNYIKPYSGRFTVGFIFLILSSVTGMVFPYLMGKLFGASSTEAIKNIDLKNLDNVNVVIVILIVVFAAQSIFSFLRIYLFSQVTENTLRDLRNTAYRHLISSPITFFNKNKVGELTSRMASDITQLQTTFNTTVAEFIRQIIIVIIGVFMLMWLSPKLSLIMLSVIPLVAIVAVIFGRHIKKLSKRAQQSAAESNNLLEETFTGIANVKAYANEYFEIGKYTKKIDEIKTLSNKGAVWRGAFVSFIIFCLFGSIVFIIWRGVLMTQGGELDQSEFISFIMYTVFLSASIGSLPDLYSGIQKAIGATENLMDLLDEKTEDLNLEQTTKMEKRLNGKVEFKNVNFIYQTREDVAVLKNINIIVQPGEQIAIVGPSGAGKSTLASLLLRFYDPSSGTILIDDKNVLEYNLSAYRNQLALVPQELILFGGTIKENIAYGKPDATDAEIADAARKANAVEFIEKFTENYNTLVGERGIQLSGGQKQRIAIARAVLKNPSILILDEATSALDSESERLVQSALVELMKNRTSFVIAHRFSTIKNASKILVIDNGQIKEMGTHNELIANENGIYNQLSKLQFDMSLV